MDKETGNNSPSPLIWPDGPMEFGRKTYVMGIINRTPDSFYDGGMNEDMETAINCAAYMISAGADIIDVGGESTRPGAARVPLEMEKERTVPFIRELLKSIPGMRISIDTYKASVAAAALEAGAAMINDISSFRFDPDMAKVAADSGVPVCLMHMRGTPTDMQTDPSYPEGVIDAINDFFRERIEAATSAGVKESQLVLDPGIGFGKTVEHNLEILDRLAEFRVHGLPLLVGASRKTFIGKTLGLDPGRRLEGSLAAAVIAAVRGADIVRVHDTEETVRAVRLTDAATRRNG